MATTVFSNGVTLTDAGWFNDVDAVTYDGTTSQILVGGGAGSVAVWTTATGTGSPVRATSPALTTPTATAIDIGGGYGSTGATIAATGNIQTNGTLTVDGTSTFTGAVSIDDTTDTTSGTTGSLHTDGGLGIAKALYVGTTLTTSGNHILTGSLIINTALGTYKMELGDTSTDLRARMTGNTAYRLAFQNGAGGVVWLGASGANQLQISQGDGTQIASFSVPITGGATTLSVDANGFVIRTPSDERYKANRKEITEGIDYVRAIPAISFEFSGKMAKQMGPGRHIGWGAQTVRDKVPYELVSGNDDLSLNDPKMGALLWSASRHLDAEITAIKAALAANNKRLEQLEKLLDFN